MAGLISAFTGDFIVSPKVAEVMIAPLDREGKIDADMGGAKVLQYWPESLDDSKSQNWQAKELPGLNNPLYQWVNGGERPFTFTAQFSRDMDGEIGKDFEESKHDVDIDAALAWLYLLSSSDYEPTDDMIVAVAPPVLFLAFMGTNLGYNYKMKSEAPNSVSTVEKASSGVHCVLTEVGVSRKNWFPSGRPRSAEVSLNFVEVIQVGRNIYPYGRAQLKEMAKGYTRTINGGH